MLAAGTTSYLYGPGGLPVESVTSSGTPTYYLQDQLGSTRLLTSSTGAVTGTYTYDLWGNITSHTGTATTSLLYAGQYQDPATGFYYLRNRYYDPVTASQQFLTIDAAVSQTQAPYTYTSDNPLNATDPSGLCSWWNAYCVAIQPGIGAISVVIDHPRLPDYVTFDTAGCPLPLVPCPLVGGVQVTVARYGQLFVGPQLGVGIPGASASIRAGWVNQSQVPCPSQLNQFVGGKSLTGSAYAPAFYDVTGPSAAETWGDEGTASWNATGNEIGWGVGYGHYAGVSQSYLFSLGDIFPAW